MTDEEPPCLHLPPHIPFEMNALVHFGAQDYHYQGTQNYRSKSFEYTPVVFIYTLPSVSC